MTNTVENASQHPWQRVLHRIAVVILILAGIEVLNQFLIYSGSVLSDLLQARTPIAQFWVGVYQQLCQATTGLLLYALLFKEGPHELGINLRNRARSISFLGRFALAWLIILAIYLVSVYVLFPQTWSSLRTAELPPTKIITATLIFGAVFPGIGEEILFRGLILGVLARWVFPRHEQRKADHIGLVVLSSFYFAVAHIYVRVAPFAVTHIDPLQIVTALGCGAVYAVMSLRTKSLLAPLLAHNLSNTTVTICGYLIAVI